MSDQGRLETMTMADGAEIEVYRVAARGPRRGGLVLVQEIFGLTDHIRELADGYAARGFDVLAPAVFDREAPGFRAGYDEAGIQAAIRIARELHPFTQTIDDIQVCIDALKADGPVFIVGYCYGGSAAWAAACRCTDLAAASGYYGSLVPRFITETPRCPTILHFGEHDHGIPLDGVKAVAAAHPEVGVHIYPAGHGFNSDRRSDYDAPSAELALERTLNLFAARTS
jgi:carboxymethylenebutenolidase